MTQEDITLIKDAIHNPDEPRHFMQVVPASGVRRAVAGATELAASENAVVVKEVGRSIYDPVIYFPRADVSMDALIVTDKSTFCPLKGDTEYFDIMVDGDRVADGAWSYVKMVLGDELKGLIAFDTSKVTVT